MSSDEISTVLSLLYVVHYVFIVNFAKFHMKFSVINL